MNTSAETPIRVNEITKERVKYLAGVLGVTQPEVVEVVVVDLLQNSRPEIDAVQQALLMEIWRH